MRVRVRRRRRASTSTPTSCAPRTTRSSIATGSRVPRDLPVPGRELDGVHYAMEYLYDRDRCGSTGNGERARAPITAAGKHVIVIGGGDTGADCVGHSHREGAASVTQIELLGEPPAHAPGRPHAVAALAREAAHAPTRSRRAASSDFAISTTKLTGNGRVEEVHWVQNAGKPPFDAIEGTEESHPAELVLLAMGFLSPEQPLLEALGVETRPARQRQGRRLRDLRRRACSPPATRAAASR